MHVCFKLNRTALQDLKFESRFINVLTEDMITQFHLASKKLPCNTIQTFHKIYNFLHKSYHPLLQCFYA